MCSKKQRELYTQFEPDANEIMFGRKVAPDRPLTEQELSKRKKIVLKFVDQKLKFDLIELLKKQHEKTQQNLLSTSTITSSQFPQDGGYWNLPPNQYDYEGETVQNEYGNAWQPSTISHTAWHCDPDTYRTQPNANLIELHPKSTSRCQYNSNLIEVPIQQFETTEKNTTSTSSNITMPTRMNIPPNKPPNVLSKAERLKTGSSSSGAWRSGSLSSLADCSQRATRQTSLPSNNWKTKSQKQKLTFAGRVLAGNKETFDPPEGRPSQNVPKRKQAQSANDYPNKMLMNETTRMTSGSHASAENVTTGKYTMRETTNGDEESISVNAAEIIDLTDDDVIFDNCTTDTAERKKSAERNISAEWTAMNQLEVGDVIFDNCTTDTAERKKSAERNISAEWTAMNQLEVENVIFDNCTTETAERKKSAERNISAEWTAMNQLAVDLFRDNKSNWAPLSAGDFRLKNEILIQMSMNPNAILLHPSAQIVRQRVGDKKLDELVRQSRIILTNLSRTDPENQESFHESQRTLIENLQKWISGREIVGATQHFRGQHSKIARLISPFLCAGENVQNLTQELIKNPYAWLSNEAVKNRIVAKGESVSNIMKNIKVILDQFIPVRLAKKFHVPADRFIDVPFVVTLFNRSTKMTTHAAGELTQVLNDSINCIKVQKPSLRDIKFKDGALEILCINSKSFDWLKNTLSNDLGVDICSVKNAIPYDQLKTICIKFHVPQYFHFNHLMEQLRMDNPRLLTKRWELRSPPQSENTFDPTKCVYVGVDVDSLIILEEMNRIGTLRDSSVYFEISYADDEENFKKMSFEKKIP